jgi:hypothetical protein
MGLSDFFKKTTMLNIENKSIERLIPQCKKYKIDTLFITTSCRCSFCKPYNRKIYSLYGWNKKYPKLPKFLLKRTCPECGVFFGASIYFPGINTKIKE